MDPLTISAIGTGINALGSIFSGSSAAKQAKQNADQADRNWRYGRADQYQELGQNDRQFGATLDDRSRQFLASLGIDIDKLYQDDRQFGFSQGQQDRQFGAKLNEDAAQFGYDRAQADRQFGFERGQADRQFGANYNIDRMGKLDERATNAARLQRALNTAPLQDRAMYMLNQRLGMSPSAYAQGGAAPLLEGLKSAAGSYQQGQGGMDTSALRSAISRMTSGADDPGAYRPESYQAGTPYQGTGYKPGPEFQTQKSTTSYTPTNYKPMSARELQRDADYNQAISRYTSSSLQKNRDQARGELQRIQDYPKVGIPAPSTRELGMQRLNDVRSKMPWTTR